MPRVLRQLIPTFRILGVAVVVWLAARASAGMAAAALLEPAAEDPVELMAALSPLRASATTPPVRRSTARLVERLTERNPFCPDCGTEANLPTPQAELEVQVDGVLMGRLLTPTETRTELPLSLLATMESPRGSLCTVELTESGRVAVLGRGDRVASGTRVALIERGLVHFKSPRGYEYLPLRPSDPGKEQGHRKKPEKNTKSARKRRSYEIPGAQEAISCSEDRTCTIERAFVERVLAKPSLLARQARVRPKAENGNMVGFRLYRVRRKSLPRLLQLRSGDLLTAVNGRALDSMDAAMNMYRELRHASHFSIEVERRGKTVRLEYDIR